MLERETELIQQIIVESTINGRDAIRLNDVLSTNLPRGVKAYMTAEAMQLLEGDFRQSRRLSAIAKSIGPTVAAERSLLRSLAMEYVFPRDEYLKVVEDTVHFLENYLCRPRWTLQQLMFENEKAISFETLDRKFERVVDYAYFGLLTARYGRRNEWKEISSEQFQSLVARIDDEIVKQHSPRELALLTKPIFDFLLFGDVSMNRPIPLGAILLFFDDKKMAPAKAYIERICQIRTRTQLSLNELIGMLEDLYQVETKVQEEVRASEEEIFKPAEPKAEAPTETLADSSVDSPVEITADSSAEREIPEPVEKTSEVELPDAAVDEPPPVTSETVVAEEQVVEEIPLVETEAEEVQYEDIQSERILSEEIQAEQIQPEEVVEKPESQEIVSDDASDLSKETTREEMPVNEVHGIDIAELERDIAPVQPQYSPVVKIHELAAYATERERLRVNSLLTFPPRPAGAEEHERLIDLSSDMPSEQRERFLRDIFKNDEEEFAEFLLLLRHAKTWRDVQPFLRNLFVKKKLDILSSDVVKFIDAMQARFHSSEAKATQ